MNIVLPKKGMKPAERELAYETFVTQLKLLGKQIGFKVSARGWCYQMESFGLIDKSQFNRVENIINKCRRNGHLPINFTAEEDARKFSGVEEETDVSPLEYMERYLSGSIRCGNWYTPYWWRNEDYYVQMLVEKIDVKTLFSPVCEKYHIPIATAKGWSSMLQRAEYAKRFKDAEEMGLKCVLLYCGDHDPDGLRISDFIRKNLYDITDIIWDDGTEGYNPCDLVIDRFGLNYDFIEKHNLTWIDNLITGSKRNLASPTHKNNHMNYVQDYLRKYGARKCEANAILPKPDIARDFCEEVIINGNQHRERNSNNRWYGVDINAIDRFAQIRQEIIDELIEFRERTGIEKPIKEAIELIQNEVSK